MDHETSTLPTARPGDEERAQTIAQRMAREKALIIDQLRKVPIVQSACEKVKVSRATFYNWKKDDADFAKQVDEAIGDGTLFMNDMAESQLLTAIREGNLGAITYWLKHRHSAYSNRMEVTAKIKQEDALTQEQERAIEEALRLTALTEPSSVSLSIPSLSHDTDIGTGNASADNAEHTATDKNPRSPTQARI